MNPDRPEDWPELPIEAWKETEATLHRVAQIVGKVRLAFAPPVNHWWHVTLYVSARGLTTSAVPSPGGHFEIELDFLDHSVHFRTQTGRSARIALQPARPVANYYTEIGAVLRSLGIEARIWPMPVEIPDPPVRFDADRQHATYDPDFGNRFWRVLSLAETVLQEFRGGFLGKCSPVHFFWGSFDLAVTRFSGRPAPDREGADAMTKEAYSHEVSSVGFWPGTPGARDAAFYAYAAPEPAGFADRPVLPGGAFYDRELKEFLFPYDALRQAPSPRRALLEFCGSTYEAAADLGGWDRAALER